jgi:hypothetical protein
MLQIQRAFADVYAYGPPSGFPITRDKRLRHRRLCKARLGVLRAQVAIGYWGSVGGRLTSAATSPVSAFRKATRSTCSPTVRSSGWISFESQGFWWPP